MLITTKKNIMSTVLLPVNRSKILCHHCSCRLHILLSFLLLLLLLLLFVECKCFLPQPFLRLLLSQLVQPLQTTTSPLYLFHSTATQGILFIVCGSPLFNSISISVSATATAPTRFDCRRLQRRGEEDRKKEQKAKQRA